MLFWLNAGTVPDAMRWAERMLRGFEPSLPDCGPALFIHADGKVELRTVEHRPALMLHRPRNWLLKPSDNAKEFDLDVVIFVGQRWRRDFGDPFSGRYGRMEVTVYIENGAAPEIVKRIATDELNRQAHARGLL